MDIEHSAISTIQREAVREMTGKKYEFQVGDTVETKNNYRVLIDSKEMIQGAIRRCNAGEVTRVYSRVKNEWCYPQ